jgi:uncharacterized protein (DUF1015 family)
MAQVKPFRAVRYDERRAGPLDSLVAPPYDVLSGEERAAYLARSPYNVVHLTLPEDDAGAAALWQAWRRDGVLAREDESALWWLAQDYRGPDGVERIREGLVCALRVEPYAARVVLPHERTHARPKEGRLRLLRALRAHVEPIFLLYDGALTNVRAGEPVVDVELDGVRNRLWRAPGADPPEALAEAQLLIADGHHRYESALAFHAEDGGEKSAWLLAVVVPTRQEGLTIFPTHRLAGAVDGVSGAEAASVEEALGALPGDRSGAVVYRDGRAYVLAGEAGELDTQLVERYARDVAYTPRLEEAVAAVDEGRAEAAFLLRPPTVDQVRAVVERGETMPQKSTYFFPKLPSGLLFYPLDLA